MLNPRSIAVVGATERMQYGGRFLRSVMQAGDRVNVYPVNPRYDELLGLPCYPSVTDLPESPDAVGIIVPYHRVIPFLRESAEKGAGSAIVISAGFSERGVEERRQLQLELGNVARDTGVRISGPNCLGLANIKDDIWACSSSSLSGMQLKSGNIGLVCQSGASAFGPFLSRAIGRGIGYSYIVSTGNEADLEAADFVRYLLDDDDTKVIALFIEGFKDARKFMEVAKLAADRGKPIVAVKIGRSDLGTRAARSHTAAPHRVRRRLRSRLQAVRRYPRPRLGTSCSKSPNFSPIAPRFGSAESLWFPIQAAYAHSPPIISATPVSICRNSPNPPATA